MQLSAGDAELIRDAITRGEKLEAIKLYREQTGATLAEAREAIEKLSAPLPAPRQTVELTLVIHALQRHGLIEAIKAYRVQTGCGLREAKLAVDEIARRNGIKPLRHGCQVELIIGLVGSIIAAAILVTLLVSFLRLF